jgi:DNA-binding response OmpR family regulator
MEQPSSSTCQRPIEARWLSSPTPKSMQNEFLLIGETPDSSWSTSVCQALASLGPTDMLPEREAIERSAHHNYQMIIIDAGAVADLAAVIIKLRQTSPIVPLVVATASPTWQTAKEVLMTGANDCIRKSVDPVKLSAMFQEILSRPR